MDYSELELIVSAEIRRQLPKVAVLFITGGFVLGFVAGFLFGSLK